MKSVIFSTFQVSKMFVTAFSKDARAHMGPYPEHVKSMRLISKETEEAFLCLTIDQVFRADWLASICSQKRNHRARAGRDTGSHQSLREHWLVQQSSSWHSHNIVANGFLDMHHTTYKSEENIHWWHAISSYSLFSKSCLFSLCFFAVPHPSWWL